MLEQLGKQAKEASIILGKAGIEDKNEVLREAAKCLVQNQEYILSENYKDVENAKSNDMSEALIDRLIASVLAEMGACAAPETRPGVRQAGGVTHVDSKAQYWGGSRAKGSVAVMDVLSPAKGDAASVGYLDWENLSFSWTFRRTEVLVVLEGDLNLSIEGTTFSAAHGDVFSIPAGTEVELSSSGHVRCATVAVAA